MSNRFVCVHGHFYQPPREDPFTGAIPIEEHAAPFPNFNEKIHSECYAPNARLGNYSRMSFNFGPTLVAWLRSAHPATLKQIVDCDREAFEATGHGAAIAQPYHHTILPLATPRDRLTEIRWGVRSFELTFGRRPHGVWLPETAIDTPTAEACAAEGLRFTILAPGQTVSSEASGSYALDLPSGAALDAVVYHGGLGGTVSFDPVATTKAEEFVERFILPALDATPGDDPLVTVATDGEVYGHHHRFKDLFLHALLSRALSERGVKPVTAEWFVATHAATARATLVERSSWGCPHGLARWATGCSCTPGDSSWKAPLRQALDALAGGIDRVFEDAASDLMSDPWAARDSYVDVVDGAREFDDWFVDWRRDESADSASARTLLEAQRLRLAMYASCAFYWEDVGRIEPGYGIRHGLAAASLIDRSFGTRLRDEFIERLDEARSGVNGQSAAELHAEPWLATTAR